MFLTRYAIIGIEIIAAFIMVLIFLKAFGMKGQLKEMTSLDLIINLTLSAILGGFVVNDSLTLGGFSIVMIMFATLVYVVKTIAKRTRWGRRIFIGVPEVIIENGKVNAVVMKKLGLGFRDIASALRTYNIHAMDEVKMAQVEPDGNLTIVKKGGENYQVIIIDDGVLDIDALLSIKKTEVWLKKQMSDKKIKNIEDVFIAQWYKSRLHIIKKS